MGSVRLPSLPTIAAVVAAAVLWQLPRSTLDVALDGRRTHAARTESWFAAAQSTTASPASPNESPAGAVLGEQCHGPIIREGHTW